MSVADANAVVGWTLMALGAVSGALIGLGFHRESWAGGYGSFRRRLMRLGHISFFGLGILNVLFALYVASLPGAAEGLSIASWALVIAGVTMPAVCFLTAWREPFRHLFPIPVLGVLIGVLATVHGSLQP
jgi:hypothetical protein